MIELAGRNNIDRSTDDDDGGLSGGIIALIVILVLLAVSVPAVIVIVYLVYKKRKQSRFDVFTGSIHHRSKGNDYITDNIIINPSYEAGQELQSSQVQEMVSGEIEAPTQKLISDDSDSDEGENTIVKNQNFDADTNKDTSL